MISHTQAAQSLYGAAEAAAKGAPAPAGSQPQTLSRDAAAKVLYRAGSGQLSDQPFASAYSPRINRAKQRDDHIEAQRLEAEQRELRQLSEELKFDDRQALKWGNALRDTAARPLKHTQLPEMDRLNLQRRFGAQTGDVVKSAADHVYKLLANKPVLLEAIKAGGTWIHSDVVETAAEAAVALGVVKPIEAKQ